MTHVNQGKNRKKGNLQSKDDGEGEGEGEGKRGSEKKKRSIMRKNRNNINNLVMPGNKNRQKMLNATLEPAQPHAGSGLSMF